MSQTDNDIIADFTRKMTMLNLALKQYLQLKMRQHNIDLTFEMLQVLAQLWRCDGINQQEIANATVKEKASMTYLIDNLTKRGLVYRQEDMTDRRNKLIYLTKEGKNLQKAIQPWVGEMYTLAGKDVNTEVIKKSLSELERMQQNLMQG